MLCHNRRPTFQSMFGVLISLSICASGIVVPRSWAAGGIVEAVGFATHYLGYHPDAPPECLSTGPYIVTIDLNMGSGRIRGVDECSIGDPLLGIGGVDDSFGPGECTGNDPGLVTCEYLTCAGDYRVSLTLEQDGTLSYFQPYCLGLEETVTGTLTRF